MQLPGYKSNANSRLYAVDGYDRFGPICKIWGIHNQPEQEASARQILHDLKDSPDDSIYLLDNDGAKFFLIVDGTSETGIVAVTEDLIIYQIDVDGLVVREIDRLGVPVAIYDRNPL